MIFACFSISYLLLFYTIIYLAAFVSYDEAPAVGNLPVLSASCTGALPVFRLGRKAKLFGIWSLERVAGGGGLAGKP